MVRQVFSFLFLLTIIGCTTTVNSKNHEERKIEISNNATTKSSNAREIEEVNNKVAIENLVDGSISTMVMDGSDLWIGKISGSLLRVNIYTNDKEMIFKDEYSIIDHSIKKILPTNSHIYILKSDSITVFNKKDNKTETLKIGEEIHRASDMLLLNNEIFITTLGYGLYKFNIESNRISLVTKDVEFLSAIATDKNMLYLGSMKNGLYLYDHKSNKFLSRISIPLQLFNKNITEMNFNNDILYVGTTRNGLITWDITSNKIERIHQDKSVSSIFMDRDKMAISFLGHGVFIESENYSSFESIRTFLKTNNITTVALLDNNIITGNLKKGIIIQEMKLIND